MGARGSRGPRDTIYAFAILLGIWLFVAGLFRIVTAIADRDDTGGTRWLMAFLGLLSVIIGILFLRHTEETVTTLAFLIGLFWVVGGIIEFFTAYSERGSPARGFRVGMGVLAFAAGVVTLVWPHLTLGVLAVIMGIWLILYGVLEIALSLPAPPPGPRPLAETGRRAGPGRIRPGAPRRGPEPVAEGRGRLGLLHLPGGEGRVEEGPTAGGQRGHQQIEVAEPGLG